MGPCLAIGWRPDVLGKGICHLYLQGHISYRYTLLASYLSIPYSPSLVVCGLEEGLYAKSCPHDHVHEEPVSSALCWTSCGMPSATPH